MTDITLDPPSVEHLLDSRDDPTGLPRVAVRWAMQDGERVVVKSATGRNRSRLRREAEALRHLRSARIVELIDVHEDDETTSLVLVDHGHRTLADPAGMSDEVLLRALHRCCEAVAELHRRGWTHGGLAPEHVVVGARGTVRLCSLGAARSSQDRHDAEAHDVHALVEIAGTIAAELHGRRPARELRRVVEDHSTSAQQLGERVANLRMSARRTRPLLGARRPSWPPSLRDLQDSTTAKVVAASLGAALLVGGTQLARAATLDTHTHTHSDTDSPSMPGRPAPEGRAPTVILDGSRYRVGLAGDLPVVGDWDCDGTATVRLLRPATGELFEFPHAPPHDRSATADVIAVATGSVTVRVEPDDARPGCHHTVVAHADGSERRIP